MKVIKPDTVSLLYAAFPRLPGHESGQGDCSLSLAALLGFPCAMRGEIAPVSEQELWDVVQQSLPEGDILDMGLPKPRAEVLVYGNCHAPQPARGAEVALRIASLDKRLHVFGNRYDAGAGPTKPEPFTVMPLTWSRTFGGPEFPQNPLGKGHKSGPDGRRHLPNVQDARESGLGQEGGGRPVGLMAMPPYWPQRSKNLGRVDDAWLQERWPGLPADYDHEYACCAPEDQRLPDFLQGGEAFSVHGMHPQKETVQGTVPALRGRLFVLRQRHGEEVFEEVGCRLETLWIFPERETAALLCRGLTATVDEECADIAAVLVAMEATSEPPQDLAHYEAYCREQLQPAPPVQEEPLESVGAVATEETPQRAPIDAAAGVAVGAAAVGGASFKELEDMVQSLKAEVNDFLQSQGLKREDLEAELARNMPEAQSPAAAEKPQEQLMQELDDTVRGIQEQTDAFLQEHGLDKAELERKLAQKPEVPEELQQQYLDQLRALEQDATLPVETRGEVGKMLAAFAQLQTVFASLEGMARKTRGEDDTSSTSEASPQPEAEAPPPLSEALSTQEALERLRTGQGLADCDLRDCDFSGQDLSGADLSRAICSNVAWPKVILAGARLTGAMLQEANLSDAVLDNADVSGAVLEAACLDRCSARRAIFRKTQLQSASLAGAELQQADCSEADASYADFSQARLQNLRGAGMHLLGARLPDLELRNLDLCGSRADADTDMGGCQFSDCTMDAICWGGVRLVAARFTNCSLDQADLAKAALGQATFHRVRARQATLLKADLTEASLRGVNLFQASLRRADLSGARLENVNLFGADLYRCRINLQLLDDVNTGRTVLDPALFAGGRFADGQPGGGHG